ncbi:MAG: protein jag [Firmicutes bacterium]|nr:protein jag [Bacillota bacterium]
MEGVEKTAKTVEEAVSQALAQLGISREEAEIEVLEEPSRGFLGLLGSRPARVRVRVKDTPVRRARELLDKLLGAMNLPVDMAIEEKENNLFIDIEGRDVGILIGRRGETLDALQYLVTLYVNKNKTQRYKVFLDVEGYRRRREETLQRLAIKLAEKAKQRGRNVVLEPMSSHERRIIHTALQGRDDIYTYSEGEEPYRKIIISPKK